MSKYLPILGWWAMFVACAITFNVAADVEGYGESMCAGVFIILAINLSRWRP